MIRETKIGTDIKRTPRILQGKNDMYTPAMLKTIFVLCLLGASQEEIAAALGIAVQTYYDWKVAIPEIYEAEKQGGIMAEARIAEGLYKRAIGFTHVTVERTKDPQTKKVSIRKRAQYYPPDVTAASLLLRNKRNGKQAHERALERNKPLVWRDKQEKDITSGGLPIGDSLNDKAKETRARMIAELGED